MKKILADFFAAERAKVIHFIRKKIAHFNESDAEDIFQDVLMIISEKTENGMVFDTISGYVYRCIRKKIIDRYRSRKVQAEDESLSFDYNENSMAHILTDVHYDTFSESYRVEIRRRIFDALEELPEKQKAVWVATELEGCSFQELSARWDVSINTLLTRKHRAVQGLRSALADLL